MKYEQMPESMCSHDIVMAVMYSLLTFNPQCKIHTKPCEDTFLLPTRALNKCPPFLQDEFTAMREQYMRGGEGFILVYTVTEKRSFDEVRRFKEMIDRVRNYEPVPMVVVGNKRDLERKRQVSTREGEAMAKEFGCPFFETSAALRQNVDEVFYEIVRCIRRKENDDYYSGLKAEGGPKGSKSRLSWLCCVSGES